ncbi:MAG: hypothetical protein ACI4O7_08780 [Aristaeellaceae bacterium]
MKKSTAWILMAAAVVLAAVSYVLLPAQVAVQFSMDGTVNTAPKLLGVLIPLAISVLGAIQLMAAEDGRQPGRTRGWLMVGIGYVLAIAELIVNLI